MKFARLLRANAVSAPELESSFRFYKEVKKWMKGSVQPSGKLPARADAPSESTFVALLDRWLVQFNALWLAQERRSITQLQAMETRVRGCRSWPQRARICHVLRQQSLLRAHRLH